MDKIVCASEEWDSLLDYYRPNGSSKTWYLKEEGKLSIPHTLGSWNLFDENGNLFSSFRNMITLSINSNIFYTDTPTNYSPYYLYIIPIFNPTFFELNYKIGFRCISNQYLNDIKKNNCKLILLHHFEGYSGMRGNTDMEIIQKWCSDIELPSENVYFISGNLKSTKHNEFVSYNIIPLQIFDSWINIDSTEKHEVIRYKPSEEDHLFLSYNRMSRDHRIYFLCKLIEQDLLNRGLVSFLINDNLYNTNIGTSEDTFNLLKSKSPSELDCSLRYNQATNLNYNHHEKTFISVVTETLVGEDSLFLSEKTWKPISIGHPFMIIGNQGTLSYLKSIGYRTFDKWIDESYDDMVDWKDRVNHVISELHKLNSLSIFQRKVIRREMLEICRHNKNHFIKQIQERYVDETDTLNKNNPIYEIIRDIWNTFDHTNTQRTPQDKDKTLHVFSVWGDGDFKNLFKTIKGLRSTDVFISGLEEWELHSEFKDESFVTDLGYLLLKTDVHLHIGFGSQNTIDNFYGNLPQIPHFNTHVFHWPSYWAYRTLQHIDKSIKSKDYNGTIDNLFISLNNKMHKHRCLMLDRLYKNGMFDYGYISCINQKDINKYNWKHWTPEQLVLDTSYLHTLDNFSNIPNEYFTSLINLVNESNITVPFLTEKTFTTIYYEKPFIILGARHIHKLLLELGFELYTEVFDYSFDDDPILENRVDSIILNLEKIKDKDYKTLYLSLREKTIRNKKRLLTLVKNREHIPIEIKDLHSKYTTLSTEHQYVNYLNEHIL